MDSLPAPRPLLVEDACSEDEENCAEAYQTLLEAAQGAVQAGAGDALQLVRAALLHTRPIVIIAQDGTELSVRPAQGGFYVRWLLRATNPMDAPGAHRKAPKSGRGQHFKRTVKMRHARLTMTQALANSVSKGYFEALLARGPRCAPRAEAALSLTALALQPVLAQFLSELLAAPSPTGLLHAVEASPITEALRSAMHADLAAFAGLLFGCL